MKRGFTLVELVVVLSVLAVLTHLAVREMSQFRDSRLGQSADAQLEAIRACVYERVAGREAEGFLADMGRMPRLVGGTTLEELWAQPSNSLSYAVRPATAENLVPGLSFMANPAVRVPTGWRGPYLRLPLGKSRLLDPWGNPVERVDAAGLPRVAVDDDGFAVAVSHYGPDAQEGGRRTSSLLPDGGRSSRLVVTSQSASAASVAWYGPASGLITGATATVSASVPAVFDGLTPGTRILLCNGAARAIDVRPGDNLVSLDIP